MINRTFFSLYMLPLFVGLIYFFLYLPIAVLVVFSFNTNAFGFAWTGFTREWYIALFASDEIWQALKNSLIVAGSSVFLSVFMGVLLMFYGVKGYFGKLIPYFYASIAVPEIVLAVGLLSFFYFFSVQLGLASLIACHTLLGLGYVIPILYARYAEFDYSLIEASLDLGASWRQTFFNIIFPLLRPALVAASLLVFIISFDDFILSFFCAGASTQTLPIYIFSVIRSGATPVVNALSTMLLLVSSLLVLLFFSLQIKKTDILP